jgi:hypothetical protein
MFLRRLQVFFVNVATMFLAVNLIIIDILCTLVFCFTFKARKFFSAIVDRTSILMQR